MNGFRTCRTRKSSSSKNAVNTPLFTQTEEIISSLVMRIAKLEQCVFMQRYEIDILESEVEALR